MLCQQGAIGSFGYSSDADGKMQGSRYAFQAQQTKTEFSLAGIAEAMDDKEAEHGAKIGTTMLAGMNWSGVTSIAIFSLEERKPKPEVVTRGIGTRAGCAAPAYRGSGIFSLLFSMLAILDRIISLQRF